MLASQNLKYTNVRDYKYQVNRWESVKEGPLFVGRSGALTFP